MFFFTWHSPYLPKVASVFMQKLKKQRGEAILSSLPAMPVHNQRAHKKRCFSREAGCWVQTLKKGLLAQALPAVQAKAGWPGNRAEDGRDPCLVFNHVHLESSSLEQRLRPYAMWLGLTRSAMACRLALAVEAFYVCPTFSSRHR